MDLDDELRELFTTDDRLDVPVRADAEELIVAGARRVRRRRVVAATASGALGVVAVIVAGLVLAGGGPNAMPPATDVPTTHRAASSARITTLPSPTSAAGPPMTAPSHTTTTTRTKPHPTPSHTSNPVTPPDRGYQVLGPTSLESLALGQSLADAQATGMLGPKTSDSSGGCGVYELIDDRVTGSVYVSTTVQAVFADPTQTPQRVGPGWTIEQVKSVYPDLDEAAANTGNALVPVPGNPAATYNLHFAGGEVTQVSMQLTNQTCF
jgi:hypothetical protein